MPHMDPTSPSRALDTSLTRALHEPYTSLTRALHEPCRQVSLDAFLKLETGPNFTLPHPPATPPSPLQVSLDAFLKLETEPPWASAGEHDERVQIVHKLLFDLLNAALRQEAARLHAARLPRAQKSVPAGGGSHGSASETLPLGANPNPNPSPHARCCPSVHGSPCA